MKYQNISIKLFAYFFFEAINFVSHLHSLEPMYPTSDVCNAISNNISNWVDLGLARIRQENRKYLFVPKTTKQSIQHKNHTIYYIYVDMIKRSGKNIEYGLKIKDNVI